DSSLPVDRLLNPCRCKSVWECRCNRSAGTSDQGSLETLARVAASISVKPPPNHPEPPSVRKSCCASKHQPDNVKDSGLIRGPDLPRLLIDPEHTFSSRRDAPPLTTPASIPSIKSVILLAGTGCSCGFECACPGCVEHRVPSSSTETQEGPNLRSRSDDCPHCVDRLGGVALPEPDSPSQRPSIIESFINRMPSLPPPPKNRSAHIDPTNVTVFPAGLFSARSAWGLVDIPRLECCGGACGCPDGRCGGGSSCAGCCVEGDDSSDSPGGSNALAAEPMSRANT
ncbi:hypothetical protein BJ322DRAFT_1012015, partial [Thelephora terrestris]